jgi:5-methylcytosine-specific restriction endonuclease McrA
VSLLRPHLTAENHLHVLATARHKSKREVEEIVATLRPKPPVPSSVRKLPTPRTPPPPIRPDAGDVSVDSDLLHEPAVHSVSAAPALPRTKGDIRPLAPESYKVQFTVSRETYDKLRQAQDLLRHRIPSGDVAEIFDRALTLLLADVHKSRHGAAERPRTAQPCATHGRHIPAAVKREVWARDGGRCAFIGATGRCAERGFLEYHHVVPFADGGATSADNLQLRCTAHNAYEAERWFGIGEQDLLRESPAAFGGAALASLESQACVTGPSACRSSG